MIFRFQLRYDTVANWTSTNPVLEKGEPAVDETHKIKLGDGVSKWKDLPYSSGSVDADLKDFLAKYNAHVADTSKAHGVDVIKANIDRVEQEAKDRLTSHDAAKTSHAVIVNEINGKIQEVMDSVKPAVDTGIKAHNEKEEAHPYILENIARIQDNIEDFYSDFEQHKTENEADFKEVDGEIKDIATDLAGFHSDFEQHGKDNEASFTKVEGEIKDINENLESFHTDFAAHEEANRESFGTVGKLVSSAVTVLGEKIEGKTDKVSNAVAGNIVTFNDSGNIQDSGTNIPSILETVRQDIEQHDKDEAAHPFLVEKCEDLELGVDDLNKDLTGHIKDNEQSFGKIDGEIKDIATDLAGFHADFEQHEKDNEASFTEVAGDIKDTNKNLDSLHSDFEQHETDNETSFSKVDGEIAALSGRVDKHEADNKKSFEDVDSRLGTKQNLVSGASKNNVPVFGDNGQIVDSGTNINILTSGGGGGGTGDMSVYSPWIWPINTKITFAGGLTGYRMAGSYNSLTADLTGDMIGGNMNIISYGGSFQYKNTNGTETCSVGMPGAAKTGCIYLNSAYKLKLIIESPVKPDGQMKYDVWVLCKGY